MKIAIEGMDGVGKSTIGKALARMNNMKHVEKPLKDLFRVEGEDGLEPFLRVCKNIYNLDSEVLKAWFFGLGNLYTIIENQDEDVVIDRHFASNYFWNGSEKSNEVFHSMINLIGVPDITIVLYASWEVRKKRIMGRDKNDKDLTDEEKMVDGYEKMFKFLDKFNIPYCVIDTENKDINTIIDEANLIVQNYKIKNKVKVL